jgi:ankyrin repeat protein
MLTLLACAAQRGHVDVVKLFIDAGANVDALGRDKGGLPIIWVVSEAHAEVLALLLDANASTDLGERYLLVHSAARGHTEIVRLLMENDNRGSGPVSNFERQVKVLDVLDVLSLALRRDQENTVRVISRRGLALTALLKASRVFSTLQGGIIWQG